MPLDQTGQAMTDSRYARPVPAGQAGGMESGAGAGHDAAPASTERPPCPSVLLQWFCLHHRADDGQRVRLAVRRLGYEVHWPRFIHRAPRKDDIIRPLFPGYMFVAQAEWRITGPISEVPNCIGLIGAERGGQPQQVPSHCITALLRRVGWAIDGVIDDTPDKQLILQPGQSVRLGDESGIGLQGIVKLADHKRVQVMMTWFGRPVTVDVERSAVVAT